MYFRNRLSKRQASEQQLGEQDAISAIAEQRADVLVEQRLAKVRAPREAQAPTSSLRSSSAELEASLSPTTQPRPTQMESEGQISIRRTGSIDTETSTLMAGGLNLDGGAPGASSASTSTSTSTSTSLDLGSPKK